MHVNHPTFGRIEAAIVKATAEGKKPAAVYLGSLEWHDLIAICESYGAEGFPPGGKWLYDAEQRRARFRDVPIFRVDAESHIAAV